MMSQTLREITSQESGMLLFPDGDLIICNWASFESIPRLFAGMLVDCSSEIIHYDTEIEEIDDLTEVIAGANLIYDRNDDIHGDLHIPATVYTVAADGIEIQVIAPDGWNRAQFRKT